jgi:outer membrane lipoprotein-sorting protein
MKGKMRKTTLLRAVLALIALSALAAIGIGCKPPPPEFPGGWPKKAPKHITSIKAEYVLEFAGGRGAPTRVWYRLPHELRLETTVGAQTFIRNKEGMFRYSPVRNRAVRMSPTAGVAAPYNPALFDQVIAASKKVGREKLFDKMCDVYAMQKVVGGPRPQDVYGLTGTKVWVWPPGKIVLQSYMTDRKKFKMKFFCRSLRYNVPMPDSLFRLPKATPVFDEEPFQPVPHHHHH